MPEESGSSSVPVYAALQSAMADAYPSGTAPDMSFSAADLLDGRLAVRGVMPGGAVVVDASGAVVDAPQREIRENGVCTGTEYDLSGSTISGTWTVRLVRGRRGPEGQASSGTPPDDDLLLYALIFG